MTTSRARDALHFLWHSLRSPATVGAIAPSSRLLARAMVADIVPGTQDRLLELGPGTGSFTAEIDRILPSPDTYLGIEREPEFVERLQRRFPHLRFVAGLAERAKLICDESGTQPVTVIISGLPFASLGAPVQDAILDSIGQLLATGGVFRTFQYVHAFPLPAAIRFRALMRERYGPCRRSEACLGNLPPAYVLTWRIP